MHQSKSPEVVANMIKPNRDYYFTFLIAMLKGMIKNMRRIDALSKTRFKELCVHVQAIEPEDPLYPYLPTFDKAVYGGPKNGLCEMTRADVAEETKTWNLAYAGGVKGFL